MVATRTNALVAETPTVLLRRRFVRLAGGEKRICEYNQEACRLNAFDGRKSLIRSFPSKVGVQPLRLEPVA